MKKLLLALSILAATACALSAADASAADAGSASFALSGAVDPGATYSIKNDGSAFLNPAMPSGSAFSDASAYGEIDGKLSFSRDYKSLGLLDFSYRDAAQLDHASGSTIESMSFTVNELYSDLNFGDLFYLRLGKQRLSWGSGYVFNPSDPVNPPKDPTNQRAILEGVPALKAEIIAKPVSLMAFSVLYDDYKELGYGAKLSTSAIPNSDVSASGYWSPSQSWTGALNASVAPLYELPGWDTVQVWFEGCAYGKGRYEAYAEGSLPGSAAVITPAGAQYAALLGASATIPVLKTVALAEYYHLSEGMTASELGSVYKALRSSDKAVVGTSSSWYGELARRPGRQASDYLFASLAQSTFTDSGDPVFDKIGLTLTCLVNLVDASTYATADLALTYVKNSSIDLTAAWAAGSADSEFGNASAALSLGLQVKVFF
jgi:hypothetical protein